MLTVVPPWSTSATDPAPAFVTPPLFPLGVLSQPISVESPTVTTRFNARIVRSNFSTRASE